MIALDIWQRCLVILQDELPLQQFNTWIRPLKASTSADNTILLQAPNRFIVDWVADKYLQRIETLLIELSPGLACQVILEISSAQKRAPTTPVSTYSSSSLSFAPLRTSADAATESSATVADDLSRRDLSSDIETFTDKPVFANHYAVDDEVKHESYLSPDYTFDTFIEGKSNQLARAAAIQVAENPGGSYNPLFLYGSVGLGKTHLMHAVGNELLRKNPKAKILYIHSDKFVADMVKAYQLKAINDFKSYYHSLDALLVDDIQFFAKKEGTQEQFFSAFNALLNGGQQIILTSDKFPKEIKGLDDRLKSRFSWGLTVAVEPPELETRVAILLKKAEQMSVHLPRDAAFYIAQRIRSNVRELEGALKRVIAASQFRGKTINVDLVKESLKDLFTIQDRLISIDNIQKTVAEYYQIKVSDLLSKRRSRSVARPRQVAMAIAKELTNHSLPEIGDAFGGRDHTTVLHACRKIQELKETNQDIEEDIKNLLRTLSS